MESLFSMESLLLQNAIRSKKKDFERGRKIVDVIDYHLILENRHMM